MGSLKLCCIVLLATLVTSCNFSCSVGEKKKDEKTKKTESADNPALKGAVIKNDIDLEATGVKLKAAYLLDADNKPLTENATRLNEKIYVILEVDTGWVKENGKSFIGAAERISTVGGTVVIDADDIFKEYETTGLDAEDSKYISLSAVITQIVSGVDKFVVRFRVWDKKGPGEIKGKYEFKIKE